MNINANVAVKEIAQPVAPAVETVDKNRPQVVPVEKSNNSAQASMDEKALQAKAKDQQLSNEELVEAVENIQARLDVVGTKLGFVLNQETEDIIIEVTDRESGDLIRQIPSEEVIEIRARLDELVGIIFDKKA